AVNVAKTEGDDRCASQRALQHLFVRANLLFEPGRVVEPLEQARFIELGQRNPARERRERPFGEELDIVRGVDRNAGEKTRRAVAGRNDAVEIPAGSVLGARRGPGGRAHSPDRSRRDARFARSGSIPAASSSRRRRCSRTPSPSPFERKAFPSHQSIPISLALSAEAINSRSFTVRSSMSSKLTWMSTAITIPLSSTRSSTS